MPVILQDFMMQKRREFYRNIFLSMFGGALLSQATFFLLKGVVFSRAEAIGIVGRLAAAVGLTIGTSLLA